MTTKTSNNSTGGVGFFGLLAIVFIVLKLTGYIAWSWWWVLSPLWLPLVVLLAGVMIYAVVSVSIEVLRKPKR